MRSNRKEAHVQDAEGFAVIWRNAQRARSELLGIWFVRLVSKLSTSHADWFKLGAPALPPAEREKSTQAGQPHRQVVKRSDVGGRILPSSLGGRDV
jgi:hypothetical protein